MVNILQISSNIYQISIALVVSLVIIMAATLNMIEKKRINVFIPFFILGLGTCLLTGFMFYDFFDVAIDVFYVFSLISIIGVFFILWRAGK